MMRKSDPGLSYVVGFIMLLMIIAMIIGTWALVGVPEQTKDAESYHAVTVTNAFLDYKIAVDNLRLNNQSGMNVSMLIPAASAYSSGALIFEHAGTLEIHNTNSAISDAWDVNRISSTFGTTNTIIGYEGGGVYRNDYRYATWVTPPLFELTNISDDLYVTLVVPKLTGNFAVGSTEGIPLETSFQSPSPVWDTYTTNQTVTITYTADDEWDAQLWYSAFFEAVAKYEYDESAGKITNVTCSPWVSGNTASLIIYPTYGEYIHLYVLPSEYNVAVGRS